MSTVRELEDLVLGNKYRRKAASLFGLHIKNGHDITGKIADQLYESLAEEHDVKRAAARSEILRRIGFNALGIVGGKEWTDAAVASAQQLGVVATTNGRIDRASWAAATKRP